MVLLIKILYLSFGFFLSINQGISIIVGNLRNGQILGSDIFMPVDIPIYLLLFLTVDKSKQSRYWFFAFFVKLLMIVFYLLSITGEFISYDYAEFRFQFVHLSRAILIFYTIASRLQDKKFLKSFVYGLLLGLGFQSFIGFWQWQIGDISLPYLKTSSGYRVTGTMGVPNAFGAYLITLIPLAIRIAFFTNVKPKILWVIISIWALGSLYATYTRGAWLAFIGAMLLFTLNDFNTKKIKRHQKVIFAVVGVVFIVFMGFKYGNNIIVRMRGSTEAISGNVKHSRMSLARDAMRIIDENKTFGVGLNNYRHFADQQTLGLRMVHNAYLLIGAEQGLVAFSIFVIAHILLLVYGLKLLKSKDKLIYNVGTATMTGYLALLVYHMVAPDYRMVGVLMQHYRLIGTILALIIMDDLVAKTQLIFFRKKRSEKIKHMQKNGHTHDRKSENNSVPENAGQEKFLNIPNIRTSH
ncbi:O-antigen ligase family protein [candidate division KSB1 bacterium]|nr:O-antigen ligase family protein [candidate division KSB1 bacterium]